MPTDAIKRWITEIGVDKVGALVTDNAAAMRLARQLVTGTEGFEHILEMRHVSAGCGLLSDILDDSLKLVHSNRRAMLAGA